MKSSVQRPRRPLAARFVVALAAIVLFGAHETASAEYLRGLWAAVFQTGFKNKGDIDNMISRAAAGHYNAIFVQVMAYMDNGSPSHGAYWNSQLVPKATDINTYGLPNGDPLAYICQQAHAYGIEVHTWLMPYRVSLTSSINNSHIPSDGRWLMTSQANMGTGVKPFDGSQYWLDPGNPEAQEYLVSIVRELVTNYPIDGIHWDYELSSGAQQQNWYPCVSTAAYSKSGLARFLNANNTTTIPTPTDGLWANFHRRSIEELLRRVQVEIMSIKSNPRQPLRHTAAVMANGGPPSDCEFGGEEAYSRYQNWPLHMQMGWIDAAIPMNYKDELCTGSPNEYQQYRDWFTRIVNCGWRGTRHLYMGHGIDHNSFQHNIDQMTYAQNHGVEGDVGYNYYYTRVNPDVCDGGAYNDWGWYSTAGAAFPVVTPPTMPWKNPATATDGIIYGRIRNWDTGDYLDNVTVRALLYFQSCSDPNPAPAALATCLTDGNGYYQLTMLAPTTAIKLCATQAGATLFTQYVAVMQPGDITQYDFNINSQGPRIVLNTTTFNWTVPYGRNVGSHTFTVSNAGDDFMYSPLNYNIADNVSWLSVSPNRGTSHGEADPIAVNYDTSALATGLHTATISVADSSASNSPANITVNVTVTLPGDSDADRDVDTEDFGVFQRCFSGPGVEYPTGCYASDLDGDGDTDATDFSKFQKCMLGEGVTPADTCAN